MQLLEVLRARARIAPYVRRTPLVRSSWLSERAGAPVWLKLESLQVSHSFKARGAFNAVIARLERSGGPPARLVTASAGNHGRALAAAARAFGIPLVVFTPADAPRTKLAAIARHGAVLRAEARDYDEAERAARTFASDGDGEFISGYSDPDVIAGAATIALDVAEERPGTAALVVPVGGGGLVSGVAAAAKAIDPGIEVAGVEAEASHPFHDSLRAGRLVPITPEPTLADGLAGNPDPETITFAFVQQFVDRMTMVTEEDLRGAIVGLIEHEHLVSEGAGAAAVAALAARRLTFEPEGDIVAIVSGSNIDVGRLASLLAGG